MIFNAILMLIVCLLAYGNDGDDFVVLPGGNVMMVFVVGGELIV